MFSGSFLELLGYDPPGAKALLRAGRELGHDDLVSAVIQLYSCDAGHPQQLSWLVIPIIMVYDPYFFRYTSN